MVSIAPPSVSESRTLNRRLMPLYAAAFFQSFVLFYAVEKLFMRSLGFGDAGIGFMVSVYSLVMLAVDAPSGILADRWSRKGVLVLASIALSLSALVGALSTGLVSYLVAAIFWGIFYACYSGMYDSIVYDVLAEEGVSRQKFARYFGKVQAVDSLALIISGLLGAMVAAQFSLRTSYWLSIPAGLAAIACLLMFREPKVHKAHAYTSITNQLRVTFGMVIQHKPLRGIVITLVLRSMLMYLVFEFAQLWLIALKTPTSYYGLAGAVLWASIGVGGLLAHRLPHNPVRTLRVVLPAIIAGACGLVFVHNAAVAVASQFVVNTCAVVISVVFTAMLHDGVSSHIRAGVASATSSIGRLCIIPAALIFGYLSEHSSVFAAGYLFLGLAVAISLTALVSTRHQPKQPATSH